MLIQIYTDFDKILFYTDKNVLSQSKLLTDGFIIDRRFLLKSSSLLKSQIKAVFLQKQESNESSSSNTFVQINTNLQENIFNYMNTGHGVSYSKEFLKCLKSNNVNLVLTSESVNDVKKAQLNSIDCSLVGYIDYNLIEYLNLKLGLKHLSSKSNPDEIKDNILNIESIENSGNDLLYYFK